MGTAADDVTVREPARDAPRRPVVIVWLVVNVVDVLQAIAFVTRVTGPNLQRAAGIAIAVLAVPATVALVEFVRSKAGWRFYVGPLAFDAFVVLMVVVDHVLRVEFRSPARLEVLVPYLALFFGSIALMGAPMYRIDRRLWFVTAISAATLISAMLFAMHGGVA